MFSRGQKRLSNATRGEAARVLRENQAGGKLPLPELLRLRFRYFSEGMALGSREFIDRLRAEHPAFSGRRRFGEPPPMPADDLADLRFARREQARR